MQLPKSLRLTQAERPKQYDPIATRRRKMIEKLDEQLIGFMQAGEGKTPSRSISRKMRDSDTGILVVKEFDRAIKPWWWKGTDGNFYIQLKYGSRPIELAKGRPSIQAESRDALERIIRDLMASVQSGDMDAHLKDSAEAIRLKFKR